MGSGPLVYRGMGCCCCSWYWCSHAASHYGAGTRVVGHAAADTRAASDAAAHPDKRLIGLFGSRISNRRRLLFIGGSEWTVVVRITTDTYELGHGTLGTVDAGLAAAASDRRMMGPRRAKNLARTKREPYVRPAETLRWLRD